MARHGFFGTVLTVGGLAVAGVFIYKNRDLIRGFLDELTAPPQPESVYKAPAEVPAAPAAEPAAVSAETPAEAPAETPAETPAEAENVIVIDRTAEE